MIRTLTAAAIAVALVFGVAGPVSAKPDHGHGHGYGTSPWGAPGHRCPWTIRVRTHDAAALAALELPRGRVVACLVDKRHAFEGRGR